MSRTSGGVAGESDIMKPNFVLLLTGDIELEQQSAMAAAASSARLIIARTVGVALEIIHQRGRELDLVVIDFDNRARGMVLLRALATSCAELPIVALTSTDSDHSIVLACANANAFCLPKPINAIELEMVIRVLGRSRLKADAAQSKQRIKPRTSKFGHTSRTPATTVRPVKEQTSL